MIIQNLRAENILKYKQLDLQEIPPHGLIAISGQNESGKSTIGETICFALFGRTFSLDHNDIGKLIRWGENRCSVTIGFIEESGESFELSRSLDIDGNHSARLCRTDDRDNPMATGAETVSHALFQLTTFGYDEFVESFYLAQREITSPQPHSLTLKTIAGLSTLEKGAFTIEEEVHRDEANITKIEQELQQQQDELVTMEFDPDHLQELQRQKSHADQEQHKLTERIDHYESTLTAYSRTYPQLLSHTTAHSRLTFWLGLNITLLLIVATSWLLMTIQPELKQSWLNIFSPLLPQGMGWMALPLIPLFFLRKSYSSSIKRLRLPGVALGAALQDSDHGLPPELGKRCNQLAPQATESRLEGAKLTQEIEPVLKALKSNQQESAAKSKKMIEPIQVEEQRQVQTATLGQSIARLEGEMDELVSHNHSRIISIELLAGASRHLSRRFNHVIREHVGMTLPLFTENRYEHLQIEDDMTIRVFSNEKRGYLELDEISSGTQRQIMLAVRLALSQELASKRVQSNQFLILDEPFAFFDQERTINSLAVLPELSEDLPQIFVTSQVFPDGAAFQREIACSRETTVLQ
ncbi:MAG: AAA family ATPase [Gammaproteobacteria bacterium]|nr:AAA family ATPase [Gammaproteobacteria bacterium]